MDMIRFRVRSEGRSGAIYIYSLCITGICKATPEVQLELRLQDVHLCNPYLGARRVAQCQMALQEDHFMGALGREKRECDDWKQRYHRLSVLE
ncbi:hypothetical protein M441DRAFT_330012 [Trichoderma asperellum CBS 433.97]|uniref:Uncharacterized protein n=1 Tax=Trichoderma asperellum (strain ATCC 204424 / CBS 433.97 / NBRC 101777) TaxID=1042311 RepID=A0A2T3YRZ1_TRIA4|nr:hypothetical protein M441DRAFT_330012 [Trichoderma asperellum CBS 433.97]PTB35335.1 hypothetical protein M441DRAFT_330012 [Trichoderma asperellum CBS 433.97]